MKSLGGLSPSEVKALAMVVGSSEARKASGDLATGDIPVDFTVHVSGMLHKAKDEVKPIPGKADPWLLLLVSLSHLNGKTIESIVKEALTADPALVENLKTEAASAIERVKAPTMTPCNGKVTVNLIAEKIS